MLLVTKYFLFTSLLFTSIFCVNIVYLAENVQVYEHGTMRVTMPLRYPSLYSRCLFCANADITSIDVN